MGDEYFSFSIAVAVAVAVAVASEKSLSACHSCHALAFSLRSRKSKTSPNWGLLPSFRCNEISTPMVPRNPTRAFAEHHHLRRPA